jgi:hypothetical protein
LQRAAKSDAMQQSKYWWETKIEEISSNIRVRSGQDFCLEGKSKNG